MNYKNIGRELAEYRRGCGLTQHHLAHVCGVNTQIISAIENGRNVRDYEAIVKRISDRLGLGEDYYEKKKIRYKFIEARVEILDEIEMKKQELKQIESDIKVLLYKFDWLTDKIESYK